MLTVSLLISAGLLAAPIADELPYGWRLPTSAELTDPMFVESPADFTRVSADLNGDSVEDIALLLRSTQNNAEALWVYLSGPDQPIWILVNETSWGEKHPNVGLSMRIDRAEPGIYECFDTEPSCDFGSPDGRLLLNLVTSGLEYFRPGSAASLVLWSHSQGKFLQVWLSD